MVLDATSSESLARHESLHSIGRILSVAVIALAIIRLAPAISLDQIHNDFSHYYIGGWLYANGLNAYTTSIEPFCIQRGIEYDPTIPYAAHPPLILAWFSLFSALPMKVAYCLWLGCQFGCVASFIELTRRILKYQWSDSFWLLILGVYFNSLSFQLLFYYSQIQLAVGTLIYAAILADQTQRRRWACCLITVASAVKIYPVLLAPWFFFRRLHSFREAAFRVGTMVITSAGCLAIPGLGTWRDFVLLGVPALADNATKWCNYSMQNLIGMLSKTQAITAGTPVAAIEMPKATAALVAVIATMVCYVVACTMRKRPTASISVLLCVTTFAGIITWSHYLTVLLLPLALLFKTGRSAKQLPMQLVTLTLGFVLLTPKIDFAVIGEHQWSSLRVLAHFYPLFIATLVVILLARLSADGRTNAASLAKQTASN